MGYGALGKSVMSLKSLHVIFHPHLSMCVNVGQHSMYSSTRGKPLSAVNLSLFFFRSNITFLSWHLLDANIFSICFGYPLCLKCLMSFFLYMLHVEGDVVLRITLVISPIAMPLCICAWPCSLTQVERRMC